MAFIPAAQHVAVRIRQIQRCSEDIHGSQSRPFRALLAQKIVGGSDFLIRFDFLPPHVVVECEAEKKRTGSQPHELAFHLPSPPVGLGQESRHRGPLRLCGESLGEILACETGDGLKPAMLRGNDVIRSKMSPHTVEKKLKTAGVEYLERLIAGLTQKR